MPLESNFLNKNSKKEITDFSSSIDIKLSSFEAKSKFVILIENYKNIEFFIVLSFIVKSSLK